MCVQNLCRKPEGKSRNESKAQKEQVSLGLHHSEEFIAVRFSRRSVLH